MKPEAAHAGVSALMRDYATGLDLTADSDAAEEPENDTHKKGTHYHGRKADLPFPVFVEPVKIFPAVFFRTENNFVKVQSTIKDDRKNSQERKRERERISTFQKTKRNNGKQRKVTVTEAVPIYFSSQTP